MAKCEICEKSINYGNKLSITRSHISKRTSRTWKPNLRSVKAIVNGEKMKLDQIDTMYMGLMLEAGDYHIQLVYQTPYLKCGLIVSVISITSLLVFMIVSSKREALRKQRDSID